MAGRKPREAAWPLTSTTGSTWRVSCVEQRDWFKARSYIDHISIPIPTPLSSRRLSVPSQLVQRGAASLCQQRAVVHAERHLVVRLVHTPRRVPSAAQTPREAQRRLLEGSPRTR